MVNLREDLAELDLRTWIRGILSAFIKGGAGAITTTFVASSLAPDKLAIGTARFFELFGSAFLINGAVHVAGFLTAQPIPDEKTVVTTVQTTIEQAKPAATIVKTVEETHTEPK